MANLDPISRGVSRIFLRRGAGVYGDAAVDEALFSSVNFIGIY
jgi:hypothetical protein